jgi:hypothetical protein
VSEFIKLYSVQSDYSLKKLKRLGYLSGGTRYNCCLETTEEKNYFRPAYNWMRKQMKARIKDFSGDYPLWAWTKKSDTKYAFETDYRIENPNEYLITIKVPKNCILISNFLAWHAVLNNDHIYLDFDGSFGYPTKKEIIESWAKIFDIKDEYIIKNYNDELQVCVDRVFENEIIKIEKI